MELFFTLSISLLMILLGALMVRLLNAQQADRIAGHHYTSARTRSRAARKGTGPGTPGAGHTGTSAKPGPGGVRTSPPVRMLTDTGVQSALPGTAVLRLETTSNRTGTLDGAWWPRSRGIESELPTLLTALTARLGPLARVGLDTSAWDDAPRHVDVDGHSVRIDWSAVGDNTMIITRGRHDHFAFLVIPPQAGTEGARAAMSMAVQSGQPMSAEQILTANGLSAPRPTPETPISAADPRMAA